MHQHEFVSTRGPVLSVKKPSLLFGKIRRSHHMPGIHMTCFAKYNPQNTDQPLILPDPSFDPPETVRIQLKALQDCNEPWPNHGIQLAYEFGYDVGGLDPSMYFGYPSDLYHLDHFMGKFQNKLPDLVNSSSFEILDVLSSTRSPDDLEDVDATWFVDAAIVGESKTSQSRVRFHLRKKRVGSRKGSFMTYMIEKL